MQKKELEDLLIVGAQIKIGEKYAAADIGYRDFKAGDVITLVEGYFEYENGLYCETVTAPAIYDEDVKGYDSIYHVFGNNLENFMDCEVIPELK